MAFCGQCGIQVADGVKFCPSCGADMAAVGTQQQPPQQQQGYGAPPQQQQQQWGGAPPQQTQWAPGDWAADAQQNKVWGVLAYILFLIPLLAAPKASKFSRYHTNQGLSFFIVWVIVVVVLNIVQAIVLAAMFSGTAWLYGYGWGGIAIFGIIGTALGIIFAIIGIIGIVHAVKGEKKPLPLVGKINILKVEM